MDERACQPPVPTEALPELDHSERRLVIRLARMVKGGQIDRSEIKFHDDREKLIVGWSQDHGACLAT